MRTIRDIPATSIVSGSVTSNLRQVILKQIEADGWDCHCIRCREVGAGITDEPVKLFKEEYDASAGKEIFLSYETTDRRLSSLLRLRLTKDQFISEIRGCALIREVHTYGQEMSFGKKGESQHHGYGKSLIKQAEAIAKKEGYQKIAVISGIGVRDYYRKLGYNLVGEYMVKDLC
jgi:elongator complex protein 3